MKRILLFLVVSISLIGCNKKAGADDETTKSHDQAQKMDTISSTTDIIVVHEGSVDQAWHDRNKDYIIGNDNNNDILIAMSNIKENPSKTARAKWLRDNNTFINYDSSSEYILKSHTIPSNVSLPPLGGSSPSLTFKAIKDGINKDKPNRYKDDRYDDYVKFSLSGKDVHITILDTFDPGAGCYSIPFLRSIVKNNGSINDNTKFLFGQTNINGTPTLYFKAEDGLSDPFDFSHNPTIPK